MVPQSLLCPAEIAEIAEIVEPSQMAIYRSRLKARNSSKFDSKLFNGPAEFYMSRRNKGNDRNFYANTRSSSARLLLKGRKKLRELRKVNKN